MILPATYTAALLLSILSMLCWGSWANTTKLAGPKWRFELFYFDYAFGVLVAAVIAALTLGNMGTELSFFDNVAVTGKRQIVYAAAAGVVFNLANILLVAAISLAGLAVAFPIGIGLALIIGVILNYFINPQANRLFLFGGVALVLVAIIVDAMAYGEQARSQPAAGKKTGTTRGVLLSLFSGVLMGLFYPIVEVSKQGDIGLGPYSVAFFFAIGVFLSTFLFNIYFMNLPVQGKPISFGAYFSGTGRMHLLGMAGGIIWCVGAISNFLAASTPKEVQVGPAVSYALGQGATLVSALWGLLVWKEFASASSRANTLIKVALLVFVAGLILISLAPKFA